MWSTLRARRSKSTSGKHPITGMWTKSQPARDSLRQHEATQGNRQQATCTDHCGATSESTARERATDGPVNSEARASERIPRHPRIRRTARGSECAAASTPRIELPHEPTQRGWSIRRRRQGVEADGCHRLNPDIARATSGPPALRAPEPAAGSVIDLRSFTPRGASRLVSPTTSASSPSWCERPRSLVVVRRRCRPMPIGVDPRRRP